MIKYDLNNRVAVVTGGAQGFGLAITERFIEAGAKVVIWDIDENAAKEAIDKVKSENLSHQIVDVTNFEIVNKNLEEIEKKHGKIDIFVNNAGIAGMNTTVAEYPIDEWKKVIDVNLTSTFLMSKSAIKKMLKNKSGKIVNITSVVGHTGNLGQANYAASKAGIVAFSKSLAIEYARKNININCVSPGFIKTEMTDKINEDFKKKLIEKIPSGDLGTGEDISNCVVFLASDMAKYINGETIHVNGGMYMA